ncbi:MAG: penicillin-binding transpeptidase domain-containing protein [Planctomycetaceae bacterium]
MRNSLFQSWKEPTPDPGWSIDAAPRARLWLVYVAFATPILLIALRLVWLQILIPDRFLAAWTRTTETFESIPATDGRILSSDGQVLAFDQPRYSIHVHYRWLEEPVNADWLKARARDRLTRGERKDPAKIAEAQDRILEERDALWQSLAQVTHHSLDQLASKRQSIQRKVEAMSQSVNARRLAKATTAATERSDAPLLTRLWKELSTAPDRTSSRPIVLREELETHAILDDIALDQIATIEAMPSRFPGVEIRSTSERVYPLGDLAPHVVGLRSPVKDTEIARRKERYPGGDPLALEAGDRYGESGIERAYDIQLRGVRGLRRVVRDHAGEIIEQSVVRPSRNGADVTLSLDSALQRTAERLLDEALEGNPLEDSTEATPDGSPDEVIPSAGSVVVLDLRSGETLIAASSPRFDLQARQHPTKDQWDRWTKDTRHPFISRVTQASIPPGSIFKVVTAIAGLEQGVLSPDQLFHCQGYLKDPEHDRCFIYRHFGQGHGDVTLSTALSQSCNVYFFDLAGKIGPQPIEKWARRLGFGALTGIDIGGEDAGNVPSRSRQGRSQRWQPGAARQFAIGQADLTVTPLQVARLMGIIGNGGHLVAPRLTPLQSESETTSPNSIQLASAKTQTIASERILSDRTLTAIREGLELTVENPKGTGHKAQIPGLLIAGKTGTAEVGGDKPDHAWFAGYVPADRPRYAFAVFLEHGGSGGKAAAPLARQVIMSMIEADLLSPRRAPVSSHRK